MSSVLPLTPRPGLRLPAPSAWLGRRVAARALHGVRGGQLALLLPDGRRLAGGPAGGALRGTVRVHRWRLFPRLLLGGRLALGDAYVDGDWDADDLESVLEVGARSGTGQAGAGLTGLAGRLIGRRRGRGLAVARRHVEAHYDLGNEFFGLWLDPSMTYSSALFEGPDDDLATAQRRKLERMATLAGLRPGQRVLEIGCGWGSFALHAAARHGCHVTGLTLSRAQLALAQERVRAAGLSDRVELRLQDWRDVRGSFDRIVSIEMLEAVGARLWPAWFRRLDALLAPGGRAAIQVICHPDAGFEAYARSADWIERRVFPGCLLGNRSRFGRLLGRTRLRVVAAHDLGPHYARTLSLWRRRFLERLPEVRALGLSGRFARTWDYYLAVCAAAFRAGRLEDWQLVLARPGPDAGRSGAPA